MNSEWKKIDNVTIPPVSKVGFKDRIIIRKFIDALNTIDDSKTILGDDLKDDFKNSDDELTEIVNNKKIAYVRRLNTGEMIEISKDVFVLGKGSQSDYILKNNPRISRMHVKILKENNKYFIEDLQSSNHTFINNEMINEKIELVDGMEFCMSEEKFKFIIKIEAS